jgi:hypothetical protein
MEVKLFSNAHSRKRASEYRALALLPDAFFVLYGDCRRQLFDDSPNDVPFELADTLENLSQKGELAGHEVNQRFYEIGSPAGLAELDRLLSSHKGHEAETA